MTTLSPWASVVIPAHDEEQVIGRCLAALQLGLRPGELDVVVVANGCTDATERIARSAVPPVRVVALTEPSKIAALNAGDAVVTGFPRAYLDADIELSAASLRAVVEEMKDGDVHCCAPRMSLELTGRPWYIRLYFRAFQALPYAEQDLVGNGVYVLSESGRRRFEQFPSIVADDLFVRNLFAPGERRAVQGGTFVSHPPRTLWGLLAIRVRVYRGNREYAERGFASLGEPTFSTNRMLAVLRRDPLAMLVYLGVNVLAKLRLRFRLWRGPATVAWERDDSGRG